MTYYGKESGRGKKWFAIAEGEIDAILGELPDDIRSALDNVMIKLEYAPAPDDQDDELLGLFEGLPFGGTPEDDIAEIPACIRLFIANLRDEAGGNDKRFMQEVRTTLLHEIGHYFGWGEGELEARGLG